MLLRTSQAGFPTEAERRGLRWNGGSAVFASTPSEPLSIERIPGPPPMRWLGTFGNFNRFRLDPIGYMGNLRAKFGDIAALADGGKGIVFAFGPEYNRVLHTQLDQFHSMRFALPGPPDSAQRRLSGSLFNLNGEEHRQARRTVLPPFQKSAVEANRNILADLVTRMLDDWQPSQVRDIHAEMERWSLRIAAALLYGLEIVPDGSTVADMLYRWVRMNTSFIVRFLRYDWPGMPYWFMLRHAERLERKLLEVHRLKRAEGCTDKCLLSMLLRLRDQEQPQLTEGELVGHCTVLFLAATETTSTSLTWALFLLAQHPDVLGDLLDELAFLHGEPPTAAQMSNLPLLDNVIKESLRLLPPVVNNYRTVAVPSELGPYYLPKGTTVAFSHYHTHHQPDLFPEPERFSPERWFTIAPSPYEYLPFGAGARMCIGASFAQFTLKLALATICQRFRLTVVPDTRIDRKVTLTVYPKQGMPMIIAKQDRQFEVNRVRGNIHEMVDLNTPRKLRGVRRAA